MRPGRFVPWVEDVEGWPEVEAGYVTVTVPHIQYIE